MTESPIPGLRSRAERWLLVAILLLTWGLRLCCLETVPPGWRDDELIEIYTLSGEVLAGRPTFYFTGASGHEPLYHTLRAGAIALWGVNSLTNHLLPIVSGTLAVPLAYRLSRRLFGRRVALLTAVLMAAGFWPLMYSRFGVRHQMLVPLALAVFYFLWPAEPSSSAKARMRMVASGVALAAALYTYTASRVIPVVLLAFGLYLALCHRERFRRWWRPLLVTLLLAAVLTAPMWFAIARGRSEAAAQGVGADARLAELAVPLRELQACNFRPLLENVWTTLGMFHATGDPEWLYNVADRPVFNLLGGVLLWMGVTICLFRWRQPCYFFLLLWLGLGLAPTFISVPPASLSHSILAMPVVYILVVLPLVVIYRRLESLVSNLKPQIRNLLFAICYLLFAIFLASNIVRDLCDYFLVWPRQELVRVLYRADYREASHYLNAHLEITDVAMSSTLLGPWDRLALDVDTRRDDVDVRLFDPGRALVWSAGDAPSTVLLVSWPHAASPIDDSLRSPQAISPHLVHYTLPPISDLQSPISNPTRFANGLELVEARWIGESELLTIWRVAESLDLPPMPIVANPPPPGVYSGPRLKVFAHLLATDGTQVGGDDGLWVDPLTLQPGDTFIQVHRFTPSADGSYAVRLGLYDPKPGEEMRWDVVDGAGQPVADHVLVLGD